MIWGYKMFKKDNTAEIVQILSTSLKEVTTTFIEELARVEKSHFEQLEKQSTKQLQILERQTKDFIGVMGDFIEASKPKEVSRVEQFIERLPEKENTIEKEEPEEFNLDEIPRIPMMGNNVGVQFDGDEEIHPINIS